MLKQLVPLIHQAPQKEHTATKERVSLDLARVAVLLAGSRKVHQSSDIGDIGVDLGNLVNDFLFHRWLFDVLREEVMQRADGAPLQIRADLVIVGHLLDRGDRLSISCMGTGTGPLIPDLRVPVLARCNCHALACSARRQRILQIPLVNHNFDLRLT